MTSPVTIASDFRLPEGLRWRGDRLWMSDMDGGAVISIGPGGPELVCSVPTQPGGLGWDPEGNLLIVSQLDARLLRLRYGRLEEVADLTAALLAQGGDVRPNDMFVDSDGCAYIGSLHFVERGGRLVGDDGRPTPLVRVDPGGEVTVLTEDLLHPNGIGRDPATRSLVVAETRASRLVDVDLDGAGPQARVRERCRLVAAPDGLSLTPAGDVWVAFPFAGLVQLLRADGGVITELDLRPRVPLDCEVGGSDGSTLFVASVEYIDHLGSSRTGRIDSFSLAAAR
jgi:sugar lactone lactonase YvrE